MEEDFSEAVQLAASSNVEAAHYDSARAVVRVTFKGGSQYDYFGVSRSVLLDWEASESVGKFLNSVLKDDMSFPVLKRG